MTITEPKTRPFGAQLTAITHVANTAHTLSGISEELLDAERQYMHNSDVDTAAVADARKHVVTAEEAVRDVLARMIDP